MMFFLFLCGKEIKSHNFRIRYGKSVYGVNYKEDVRYKRQEMTCVYTEDWRTYMSESYETAFGLILNAGNSKSKSLMAIEEAREFHFQEARDMIKEAEADLHLAHQSQTDLIQAEARGEHCEVNIMMIHAQDHLTTAMILIDQAKEFLHIYEILSKIATKEDLQ